VHRRDTRAGVVGAVHLGGGGRVVGGHKAVEAANVAEVPRGGGAAGVPGAGLAGGGDDKGGVQAGAAPELLPVGG
jgi:hypothetical protein